MMTAAITTQGVYIFANLVIKRSIFGLLAAAFSMDSRIRETIDSDNGFSTRIFNWPDVLTQPDVNSIPHTRLLSASSQRQEKRDCTLQSRKNSPKSPDTVLSQKLLMVPFYAETIN